MEDPTTTTSPDQPLPVSPWSPPPLSRAGDSLLTCPKCRAELPISYRDVPQEETCSYCRTSLSVRTFPRIHKEPVPQPPSELAGGDEASCHFYPELKAEVVCDECGCFLSRKASIQWGSQTLCMPCLHTLREEKADTGYRAQLKIWDNRALGLLALLPFTLFTGPIALFLLFRFRKEPLGWVPRSRFRWWLAMSFAIVILLAWIAWMVVWIAMVARELG